MWILLFTQRCSYPTHLCCCISSIILNIVFQIASDINHLPLKILVVFGTIFFLFNFTPGMDTTTQCLHLYFLAFDLVIVGFCKGATTLAPALPHVCFLTFGNLTSHFLYVPLKNSPNSSWASWNNIYPKQVFWSPPASLWPVVFFQQTFICCLLCARHCAGPLWAKQSRSRSTLMVLTGPLLNVISSCVLITFLVSPA